MWGKNEWLRKLLSVLVVKVAVNGAALHRILIFFSHVMPLSQSRTEFAMCIDGFRVLSTFKITILLVIFFSRSPLLLPFILGCQSWCPSFLKKSVLVFSRLGHARLFKIRLQTSPGEFCFGNKCYYMCMNRSCCVPCHACTKLEIGDHPGMRCLLGQVSSWVRSRQVCLARSHQVCLARSSLNGRCSVQPVSRREILAGEDP